MSAGPREVERVYLVKPGKRRGDERLGYIYDSVRAFLNSLTAVPVLAAIEGYSYGSTSKKTILAEARGVIRLAVLHRKISLIEVSPKSLKLFATGRADRKKAKIIEAVGEKYGYKTNQDDIADAVVLSQIARVYSGGQTTYRSELEVVHGLRNPKTKKKVEFTHIDSL